jgi:hypothetical protein
VPRARLDGEAEPRICPIALTIGDLHREGERASRGGRTGELAAPAASNSEPAAAQVMSNLLIECFPVVYAGPVSDRPLVSGASGFLTRCVLPSREQRCPAPSASPGRPHKRIDHDVRQLGASLVAGPRGRGLN